MLYINQHKALAAQRNRTAQQIPLATKLARQKESAPTVATTNKPQGVKRAMQTMVEFEKKEKEEAKNVYMLTAYIEAFMKRVAIGCSVIGEGGKRTELNKCLLPEQLYICLPLHMQFLKFVLCLGQLNFFLPSFLLFQPSLHSTLRVISAHLHPLSLLPSYRILLRLSCCTCMVGSVYKPLGQILLIIVHCLEGEVVVVLCLEILNASSLKLCSQ